jgi:hypothetical protein
MKPGDILIAIVFYIAIARGWYGVGCGDIELNTARIIGCISTIAGIIWVCKDFR